MARSYMGVVRYANGEPAVGVKVRLFDKDWIGKDDDLTVVAGVSDGYGRFTVIYDPTRDLDFADIYLPYLEFRYDFNGNPHIERKFIQPFKEEYHLPQFPPVKFIPSQHGLQFVNRFPGYWLPFSIPTIPDIPSVSAIYGLCGGMCATSYDFALVGLPTPPRRRVPGRVTPLHMYLHRRQVDSLGHMGKQVIRFIRWMTLPDEAVQLRTAVEVKKLKIQLDVGVPSPLGLVYVSTRDTLQIWQNHQVLAVGYRENNEELMIQLYEPNYPRRDDIYLKCWPDGKGGLRSQQLYGEKARHVRGFFMMPYNPVLPPKEMVFEELKIDTLPESARGYE
ncbi:MAG: hypothetical protein Kow0080_05820 [Candidatus Promineifilaceae bacterium]